MSAKAPVHLWIVGVLALLWNGFGCIDYTMTQTGNAAWLAQLTPAQRAWLAASPAWALGSWALGVWGGLVGAVLLLARRRAAVGAFAVSLAGLAVNTLYMVLVPMPGGGDPLAFRAVIAIIAIGLLLYALAMRRRGVLR